MNSLPYLSILIPIFNEERTISKVIEKLAEVEWPFAVEIVIIDDGSSDRTFSILQEVSSKIDRSNDKISFLIERFKVNSGKGSVIQKCIELCSGEVCLFQDADFEYEPRDILELIKPIQNNSADIVYGNRFVKSNQKSWNLLHYFANRFLTLMSNVLSGLRLADMETCYKLCRTDILKNIYIRSPRFGIEPELAAHFAKLDVRISQLPIRYFPRNYSEGKKITWKDGVAAIWHIIFFNYILSDKLRFKLTMPEKFIPKKLR